MRQKIQYFRCFDVENCVMLRIRTSMANLHSILSVYMYLLQSLCLLFIDSVKYEDENRASIKYLFDREKKSFFFCRSLSLKISFIISLVRCAKEQIRRCETNMRKLMIYTIRRERKIRKNPKHYKN